MKLNRFLTTLFLLFSVNVASLPAISAEITEGKDYIILTNPQPTKNNGKIEVLEFFWYGCPHCDHLHPHIKTWLKNKPEDVSFHHVPTIFRTSWVPGAKIFYAIDSRPVIQGPAKTAAPKTSKKKCRRITPPAAL